MKRYLVCIIVFLIITPIYLSAQHIIKLSEVSTIIGTQECVDYNTNRPSTTVNTAVNVFDGNYDTFFATYQRSGGWVGLALSQEYVITKVAYCPRNNSGPRLQLGIIEGANNPDFGDAVPLLIIKDIPQDKKMTEVSVDCSKGFRYVRYVGPNNVRCNIAELEFYGYRGGGDNTKLSQLTNLPTVTIHTVDAEDIIIKEKYLKGIISVISEDGTKIQTDSLEIRGRGNASWGFEQKPYRFKLYKKARLAGLPSNRRKWTLISNYGDKSLMRNLLAYEIAKRIQIPYSPAGRSVDLILNGEYKGNYQLFDQIEVQPDRVNVPEMLPTDISGENLTGGYLLEIDAYAKYPSKFVSDDYGMPVTIKSPDEDDIVQVQRDYIISHFNKLTKAVKSDQYFDFQFGFRRYMDTDTFLRHFLINEVCGNSDTYWSTYMYKKRSDNKFYFGPVWDFDVAFENDNRTYPINAKSNWLSLEDCSSAAPGAKEFARRIFSDTQISKEVKKIYSYYRDRDILSSEVLVDLIEEHMENLQESQKLNFIRWNILGNRTFEEEVNIVRNYLNERFDWIDRKVDYVFTPPVSDQEKMISPLLVWTENNMLHIDSDEKMMGVEIIDIMGRSILLETINSTTYSTTLPKGIYVIHINGMHIHKCIIP